MIVRPKKKAPAHKGNTPKPPSVPFTFPAPIRGWTLDENLGQVTPASASILDNWVCTTTGIRARGGKRKYATLGAQVRSIMTYRDGSIQKMLAATADSVFDISTVVDASVVPAPVLTGLANGDWSTVQFGTVGSNRLIMASMGNAVRNYDGATFTIPAITGVGIDELSQVWSFANRLFFVEGDTMNAWYLPVDSFGGAAAQFSLAGVFKKGGSLLFGASWSLDAGDGLDDKCVFVSTEGEVAVYQGTNPGSAATWSRAGLYAMPRPMGKNAYVQAGGDLLIATEAGLIPVSASVRNDLAAIEFMAVSRPIAPYWQRRARELSGSAWDVMKYPRAGYMMVSQPDAGSQSALVVNLQTGAWSRFTGWDTQCLEEYEGDGFFGSTDGRVYRMESGGSDDGDVYTCVYVGNYEAMGLYGQQKTVLQMRPVFQYRSPFITQLRAQVDYGGEISSPPNSPANYAIGSWDSALWDVDLWDQEQPLQVRAQWISIGNTGHSIAPELQLSFGYGPFPDVELVLIDAQFRAGAVVT